MELRQGMECPGCEEGVLNKVRKDLDFEYKGKVSTVKNCISYVCSKCGDSFQNKKERRVLEKILTDNRREIDGLLTSSEIKRIRSYFGLTQEGFAKALTLGEKNFARYESGIAIQGRSLDNLLKVLDRFPHAIRALGVEWPPLTAIPIRMHRAQHRRSMAVFKGIVTEDCNVACELTTATNNGF